MAFWVILAQSLQAHDIFNSWDSPLPRNTVRRGSPTLSGRILGRAYFPLLGPRNEKLVIFCQPP